MSRRRVMIVGVTGALGGSLARSLSAEHAVVAPRPRQVSDELIDSPIEWLPESFDAASPSSVGSLVAASRAHTFINAVAITPKHAEADDEARMQRVNADFPHRLAAACQDAGARLIHISSDAVFSGSKGGYAERDKPDPTDTYGRTKLAGEVWGVGVTTLRTTFFGLTPQRPGLLDWFIRQRGKTVQGYVNYRFSGLSLRTLGLAIGSLVEREEPLDGVYHAGGETVSKLDLLSRLDRRFSLGVDLRENNEPFCDRSLDSHRFWTALGREAPTLDSMIEAMAPEIEAALRDNRRAAA